MTLLSTLASSYRAHNKYGQYRFKYVGLVGFICYPLFYVLYTSVLPQEYPGFTVRVIATGLCLFLALKDYWPEKFKSYYLWYAYFTILFILPFFHTIMILHNDGNIVFVSDSLMALFFTILIVDWRNMIVMYVLGSLGGIAHYLFITSELIIPMSYVERLPTFILVAIGGYIFKHLNEKLIGQEKLQTANALGGSIAHEMRNPLNGLKLTLQNIEQELISVQKNQFQITKEQDKKIHDDIAMGFNAIHRSHKIIDITLKNLKGEPIDNSTFVFLPIGECIEENLMSYGYQAGEKSKIAAQIDENFIFKGDANLFAYILFNLMKNAFYYLSSYPKSKITIWTERGYEYNSVYFKDTGPGIPEKKLPELFGDFVSFGKKSGTGLGLSFCKRAMSAFGGSISCNSVEGEYTEFVLRFPKVDEENVDIAYHFDRQCPLEDNRILIVDDSKPDFFTTKAHFVHANAIIDEARSGQEAINLMKEYVYDLVLMDIEMPVMNGMETTAKIREGKCFDNGQAPNHQIRILKHSIWH